MALTAEEVVVIVEAKLDKFRADVRNSAREWDSSMQGIQRSSNATEGIIKSFARGAAGALATIGVGALARTFLDLADRSKQLEAQLKLATSTFGNLADAQEDVRRIAEETRTGLESTADLYGTFMRNARELGITQEAAARSTETFSKTLQISGAGAAEASAATTQFSQALASGVLRGDEFNSIMESAPRLSRLLADSLNVPVGSLRAMAEQGELTADKLVNALTNTKFTAGIDQEFRQLPVTFDQAMEQVQNAAILTFGAFDRGGEFSTALANFITDGSDGFKSLEQSAEDFGISVRGTLEGLGSAFAPLVDAGLSAFEALGISLSNFSADGRKEIAGLLGAMDDLLNIGPSIANMFGANGRFDSNFRGRFLASSGASDAYRQERAQNARLVAQFGSLDSALAGLENPAPSRPSGGSGGATTRRLSPAIKQVSQDAKKATNDLDAFLKKSNQALDAIDPGADAKAYSQKLSDFTNDIGFNDGGYLDERAQAQADADRALYEQREEYEREHQRIAERNIYDLARIYEDGFRGGVDGIWDDFKRIGEQVIAQLLAKWTFQALNLDPGQPGNGPVGGIASVIGSIGGLFGGVPGFATGGSMRIGGRLGSDRNLLSLNGQPLARVSAGETLNIGNPALAPSGASSTIVQPIIQVDARGAVMNDQFASMILAKANAHANQAAAAAGRTAVQAAPAAIRNQQRYGMR